MITYKKLYKSTNLKENEIILDIETTGLDSSSDNLVLLGLIEYQGNKAYIIQYFAQDNDEEKRILEIYLSKINNKKIISFNGDKFDIPFLNKRLIGHSMFPVMPESFDLYKLISSKRKFFKFESMKLMDLEKKIGIMRNDPSRYKVISKLTDDIKKREKPKPIMIHNKNDLISTEKLLNIGEYFDQALTININNKQVLLEAVLINNDICQISLKSKVDMNDAYFQKDTYELRVQKNKIEINIQVLYGKFDEHTRGFVCLNIFKLKNESSLPVDENLLIIRENYLYNSKNILNLSKKIIENHL